MTILGVNAAIQHNNKKLYLFDKEILCVALDGTCTFVDGSDVMLEPEHLRDLKLQVQGCAPTFHTLKPEKPRDTQFAGFAKALWDELPDVPDDHFQVNAYDDWSTACEKILTQRAYDFAYHVRSEVSIGIAAENEDGELARRENMRYIPDLAELPEVSE
jgi:hypothetical protein